MRAVLIKSFNPASNELLFFFFLTVCPLLNFLKFDNFLLRKIRKQAMLLAEVVMIDQSQHGKAPFKEGEKNQLLGNRVSVYGNQEIPRR